MGEPRPEARLAASELAITRAGRTIFSGIGFALGAGELLQVLGANGSGKTSLLRVLGGLLAPSAGEVRWGGRRVRGGDDDFQRALAYVGHANGVDPDLNALENLRFSACLADGRTPDAHLRRVLDEAGLAAVMHLPARALSEGQRRRVALARLALSPRALWLLDEPLTSLDAAAAGLFLAQLGAHLRTGGMAVLATHQKLAAAALAGRELRLG